MNQIIKYAVFLSSSNRPVTKPASYSDTKKQFEKISETSWQNYGCGVYMERVAG